MTDADEIEKQIGGEGVTAAATSSGAQGGASNNTNNNSGGGVGLSFIDTSDYNNNQSSEDKRTSLLDVVRESLQRQGKVKQYRFCSDFYPRLTT